MLSSFFENARREARFLAELARTYAMLRELAPASPTTFADLIEAQAAARPQQVAIAFEQRRITFAELDASANRVARWARAAGIGRGDAVALSMENRPEFLISWLGLAKVGAVAALQNTQLSGASLAHCLREVGAKHWIVGAELAGAAASALGELASPPAIWLAGAPASSELAALGELQNARSLDAALAEASPAPLDRHARRGLSARDRLFYIYTSGTTGLPKAANVSHARALATALGGARATRLTPSDRIYVALPLYHSAGGVMAAGAALLSGATLVLARKFSASQFWSDCAAHEATVFQYIGELCRYLLNAPEHADEKRHRIRACIGNGLRPEVWAPFQKRFAIPSIIEFYGATEGNLALVNLDGKVGAVGRLPSYLRGLAGVELVRFDSVSEAPLRGDDGFCERCDTAEAGELIGRIGDASRFEGYSNAGATEQKILRDVFRAGDAFFRSGDLLRFDAEGYYYFVDRIGDTFRWKGQNVASTEVAEALSSVPGVREACVYGVAVPGADGRAGMAALVVDDARFELAALRAHLHATLPSYARPLFVRLVPGLDVTGTFKQRKQSLVADGFDPSRSLDAVYFDDPRSGAYLRVGPELFGEIDAGTLRV